MEFSLTFNRYVQWQMLSPRQCSGSDFGLQKMLSSMLSMCGSKDIDGGTKEILLITPTRVKFSKGSMKIAMKKIKLKVIKL